MKRVTLIAALAVVALLPIGCTTTEYSDAQVKFKRTSFFNTAKIGKLQKTADGILLEGYVNDQISGAAIITEAAVGAALKGAK